MNKRHFLNVLRKVGDTNVEERDEEPHDFMKRIWETETFGTLMNS